MRAFTEAADAVARTTRKNEKVRILSELLKSVSLRDAEFGVQFLTGRAFAQHEERVTGVGGSTLFKVVAELAGRADEDLGSVYRQYGDLGAMAEALLATQQHDADLPLADVAVLFGKLSEARTQAQKAALLYADFAQASAADIKYIVKILTADLRIGLKESLVEEAISLAFSRDAATVRRANLLLGDIGETLRLAAADRLGTATARLFHPLGFMLASPVESAKELFVEGESPRMIVEHKYDGIRAQVHKDRSGKVKLFSRTRDEIVEFPELQPAFSAMPGELILDGEILGWRSDRPLPFTELQQRLGRKQMDLWTQHDVPVRFLAFDLLFHDGDLLLDTPLLRRKERLQTVFAGAPEVLALASTRLCTTAEEADREFSAALTAGHEGIVAKRAHSLYTPGRRGRAWLKWKVPYATLDVVVTAAEYGHGKRHKVLSDVTFAVRDGARLRNIGKAYSGLTDEEIRANTDLFLRTTLEDQGFRRTVEPQLVIEVAFNNIQRSRRHDSGFALRFPRIVRIRNDKLVSDIDTLARVEELFLRQAWQPSPEDARLSKLF